MPVLQLPSNYNDSVTQGDWYKTKEILLNLRLCDAGAMLLLLSWQEHCTGIAKA